MIVKNYKRKQSLTIQEQTQSLHTQIGINSTAILYCVRSNWKSRPNWLDSQKKQKENIVYPFKEFYTQNKSDIGRSLYRIAFSSVLHHTFSFLTFSLSRTSAYNIFHTQMWVRAQTHTNSSSLSSLKPAFSSHVHRFFFVFLFILSSFSSHCHHFTIKRLKPHI